MRNVTKIVLFFVFLCCIISAQAQDQLSFGFKTGLSFSNLSGDVDPGEEYTSNVGFHIGMIFKYKITDLFGIKGEFLYSQKGSEYRYVGPSAFYVQMADNPFIIQGERDMDLNISNDYIDLPVMAYVRLGPVELSAGVNLSILAGSSAGGQLRFAGTSPFTSNLAFNLDHRYYGDEAGEALTFEFVTLDINNEQYQIPLQQGAYYEYAVKDGPRYRLFDIGINAEVDFYINQGLYLGVRGNYGLLDVSRPEMDITYRSFDDNYPAFRNDKDNQLSIQVSLGFSF